MINLSIQLPADFLKEEERCGYVVTKEMKEIWAVELDLYAEFQRVCKKYQLQYFACGGTMLGAVRHKGFIPWDDDIDLMMFRDQYDKLCNIAHEFKHPYFFQTEYTDPGSMRRHAQLRNSLTTAILDKEKDKGFPFNQGIFIDIFPLDAVPDDCEILEKLKIKALRYLAISKKMANFSVRYTVPQNRYKRFCKKIIYSVFGGFFGENYQKYYRKYEETISKFNNTNDSTYIINPLFNFNPKWFRLREDFKDSIDMDFEFLKMPVPINYDSNLRRLYGDYNIYVKGGSMHGEVFFDTDKSYKEYIK